MTDDSGIMSVDFLVGFTIFIIAFIWVATMVPGLFIGIKSHSVDFDAVAYRTGVILAEDPGAIPPCPGGNCTSWETQPDNRSIARFGLAYAKNTPNILDERKVMRFFNTSAFSYPDDYRTRVIFGDYPYRFNISLKRVDTENILYVGDIIPDNYGYIRRDVKIKTGSNTTIGETLIKQFQFNNTKDVRYNVFSIVINSSKLSTEHLAGSEMTNRDRDIIYRINPIKDRVVINITDFDATRDFPVKHPAAYTVSLSKVVFIQKSYGATAFTPLAVDEKDFRGFIYEDGNDTPVKPPINFEKNISMIFEPGFFKNADPYGAIFINLTFDVNPPQQYLNNTHTRPFDYNHIPANVTQPELVDGVLEVAVW